jgi:hypothetical protein
MFVEEFLESVFLALELLGKLLLVLVVYVTHLVYLALLLFIPLLQHYVFQQDLLVFLTQQFKFHT